MAGSITYTSKEYGHIKRLTFSCTAASSDAEFPELTLPAIEGRLLQLQTIPSTETAPSNDYDIKLNDAAGYDRLEGVGADRSSTVIELKPIVFASSEIHPYVDQSDRLKLQITNSTEPEAGITVNLFYGV